MKVLLQGLLTILLIVAMTARVAAGPCNVLLLDEAPCELQWSEPAPYTGTLMTKSTARGLHDKVREGQQLRIELDALRLVLETERDTYENRIVDLKIQLEGAPRPLLEQPWFWIGVGGALIGGFAMGWTLAQ